MEYGYETYKSFKGWNGAPDASHDLFYQMETSDLGLKAGSKVIEIGFGEGRFLDFSKRSGWNVRGLELISHLVDQVRTRGHVADVGTSLKAFDSEAGTFELIAAFDVIEHLTLEQITKFLEEAKLLLSVGGHIILRFPNGNSPFSFALYNSDVTHRSHITGISLAQICDPIGFDIVRVGNAKRDIVGSFAVHIRRRLQYALRSLIELTISAAYFGNRVPMDANLVAVLRKR